MLKQIPHHSHRDYPKLNCEHILKHCKECEIVYCEKCNKEWNEMKDSKFELPETFKQFC